MSGLGCLIGPCSEGCRSMVGDTVVAGGGRGGEGKLEWLGSGGGPITADVLRE